MATAKPVSLIGQEENTKNNVKAPPGFSGGIAEIGFEKELIFA
jgi:hypothetical protein